jgi:AsmA protein
LSLRTGEGHFGNAPGFGPGPMVAWKSAQLGAKLFPLVSGKLVADRVLLSGADLRLVRHADGLANWQGLGGKKPGDPDAKPMEIHIDGVKIENGRVSFVDETVPRRVEVTALNLTTDEIAPGKPFGDTEIAGVLHMDGFTAAGVPFRFEVPKAVIPEDFASIEMKAFTVAFGGLEAEGGVSGTLGEQPKLAGQVKTNTFDPRALLTSLGITPPKTTDAHALGKVQFSGDWALDGGAIRLEPFTLDIDDTHFAGSFSRSAGDAAVGELRLAGTSIDLARYIPPADPNSEPFVLPTAALKALRFRGEISLAQATLDDIAMKGLTLRLVLDDQGLHGVSKQAAATP